MASSDTRLELLITVGNALAPIRVPLHRALTTIGSVASADARVPGAPPHWLVVQRQGAAIEVCELATGSRVALQANQALAISGAQLLLAALSDGNAPLPVAHIADALAGVQSADGALALLLERVIAITAARFGAIIMSERGSYRIAVARNADGTPLEGGERLLSDTIVRDALQGGVVAEDDLAAHERYRNVPSVRQMQLDSVLAVPMALGDRVLGAVYLGRHGSGQPFGDAAARDLTVIASMAIPFIAQLRRDEARRTSAAVTPSDALLGECEPMTRLRELVARIAPTELSVLITGETGTGKEVTARAIHNASARAAHPMVALNCSAITPTLLEAELFGYCKGAFTGAVTDRAGRIEAANGSTLFLDEVGDMPLPMQASLLRVLQEREIVRIGENQPRAVDFRLIAATHRDLDAAAAAGSFRSDLLFRIREMPLASPPLRERGGDITHLARLFLRQAELELGLAARELSPDADDALLAHPWPGNVRELRATLRRAAVLATAEVIEVSNLGLAPARGARAERDATRQGSTDRPLSQARDEFVRDYVALVLDAHGGNREAAAASLGISVRSLYRHLNERP